MAKIKKSGELLWLLGVVFVALGVAICSKANLGVSMIAAPAFVIHEALSKVTDFFSIGSVEYIVQGILLIILCIVVKKVTLKFLLTFVVAIIYGLFLDLFLLIFQNVSFNQVWLRWVMLIVGDLVTAFGVACLFRTFMPLQVYELFVATVSKTFNLDVNKTKWTFDISLLVLSLALAFTLFGDVATFDWSTIGYNSFHSIGLGTIVTTFVNSPMILLMGKVVDRCFDNSPLFPKLEAFFNK